MHTLNFRERLEKLIAHLGVNQTEMGEMLGITRNMVSMLLSKNKEQKPSKAVQLLFEQVWDAEFGEKSIVGQKLPLSGSFIPDASVLIGEEPAIYIAGTPPDAEIDKALNGCDAVYDLLHTARTPEELTFAVSSFDRAWNRYKLLVQNKSLQLAKKHGEYGETPCQTLPASSADSALQQAAPSHATLVNFPTSHFMSVEEAIQKGVKIPKQLLDQLTPVKDNVTSVPAKKKRSPNA